MRKAWSHHVIGEGAWDECVESLVYSDSLASDSKGKGRKTDTRQVRGYERLNRVRGRRRHSSAQVLDDWGWDTDEIIYSDYRHWDYSDYRSLQALGNWGQERRDLEGGIWKVGSGGYSLEVLLQKQTMSDERTTISTRAWWAGTGRRSRQRTLKNRMREEQNQKHVTAGCPLKPITPVPTVLEPLVSAAHGPAKGKTTLHSFLCSSVWPLCLSQPDVSRCVPILHPYTHTCTLLPAEPPWTMG